MQFALVLIVLVGFVSADIPIPLRPDGYGVGGPADAHVVIEMFLDLLCPDCKGSWPTVLQVIQAYGTRIHFRIHTFPLPYHTNAFVAAQGLHVVANITNRNLDAIYQYATKVFENQQIWYNEATKSMTMTRIIDSVATFAANTSLVSKDKFMVGMMDENINEQTRVSWKYGCSRAIAGTPTFLINGVSTSADASWSLSDWKSVIDPLLATNEKTLKFNACPSGQVQCNYAPHKSQCCLSGERCIPNVGCRC